MSRQIAENPNVIPIKLSRPVNVSPEITWSLMHPVKPDAEYMRAVIAAAAQYHVDSFEICGDVHGSGGGMDGAIRFRDYPAATSALDLRSVTETIASLRAVLKLAHDSGRPVYYWHREVMVPRAVVERIPGLLDENGEFDLLGDAYPQLVRSKLAEFFDNVPEMDGIVLTLTESDYSVIHNSDPRRYPPRAVVRKLVSTFAEELHRRKKRFILRSFGSIAQDYEDILAGVDLLPLATSLEIETKITPYDFSPFLPFNPYLRHSGRCALSAEYDSIGEFLGAGYLPAPDPARVIDSVTYARRQGVERHVIRIDRIGHATFTSPQAVNLLAFDRAILDPNVTAEAVWKQWAAAHWPDCADRMTAVMQRGIAMVKKTHFIDGHVIFHAFPIQPELKWIQACGILSVFAPNRSLDVHRDMWGILPDRTSPDRTALRREKDEAVALADEGLADVERLRGQLAASDYETAHAAWQRATVVTRAVRAWCRCIAAYFDDMEQQRAGHPTLDAAITAARAELHVPADVASVASAEPGSQAAADHEYGDGEPLEDSIEAAYVRPLAQQLPLLQSQYEAEFRERAQWRGRPGVFDFVVCGGFLDDIRVNRSMHASHARLWNGRPARFAGNRVFPNGYMKVSLALPPGRSARLVLQGDAGAARRFSLTIDGRMSGAEFSSAGEYGCEIKGAESGLGSVEVRVRKLGSIYPAIFGLAVLRQDSSTHDSL